MHRQVSSNSHTSDQDPSSRRDVLGVIIVTFRSGDVIAECLESLAASAGVDLKIVVVDNASPDSTTSAVLDWASGAAPFVRPANSPLTARAPVPKPLQVDVVDEAQVGQPLGQLTLLRSQLNRGFAGGVNLGLAALRGQVGWCWILNPDCAVPEETAAGYVAAARAHAAFALMSGVTRYYDAPDRIQSAGGWVDRFTGVCHQRCETQRSSAIDWVTGANLLVSPTFLDQVGPMREDYFLYYEEVDWAFRRGSLPIVQLPNLVVYHRGGTSIGSGALNRRPSPFSNYFNHRNRIRFARRFLANPIGAYLYGLAKAVQLLLIGAPSEAQAIIAGMLELEPSPKIRSQIGPKAAALAFGRLRGGA